MDNIELSKKLRWIGAKDSSTFRRTICKMAAQRIDKQAAELEKQLQVSGPDMVRLGTYLEALQEAFGKILDVLKDIQAEDPDTATKLRTNTKTKVLEQMIRDLEDGNSGTGA